MCFCGIIPLARFGHIEDVLQYTPSRLGTAPRFHDVRLLAMRRHRSVPPRDSNQETLFVMLGGFADFEVIILPF
jgi:hypothetical protein